MDERRDLKGLRVLIVDDAASIRTELERQFVDMGCDVVGVACDGMEALEQVEALHPDLISLDIVMPNMDGIECYQHLQERFPEIKVLFISVLSLENRVVDAFSHWIPEQLFLPKPVHPMQLRNATMTLMGITDSGALSALADDPLSMNREAGDLQTLSQENEPAVDVPADDGSEIRRAPFIGRKRESA